MKTTSFLTLCIACLAVLACPCGDLLADSSSDDAIQAIAELIGDKDKDIRALGMQQVREEVKGEAATKQFALLLPKLSPSIQAELVDALATRGDKAARPAVLDCLKSPEPTVHKAAILALGRLGEPADVPRLTQLLAATAKDDRAAAQTSLVQLCGSSINGAIAAELKSAKPEICVALVAILQSRRATDNAADILAHVQDADPRVRAAAMSALGQLAGPEQVAGMAAGVLKAKPGAERDAAGKAVMFVCNREKNPDRRAAPLLAVWKNSSADERTALLPTLGRIGGAASLEIVEAAIRDSGVSCREAGIQALCNWPDASVAPQLIEMIKTAKEPDHRRLALQALTRVAALPDNRSAADRLALLQTAMTLATTDDQRNFVLKRAKAVRTIESLRFVAPFLDKSEFAQEAGLTVVELAHHRGLREPNKAEFDRALDQVLRTSKNAEVIDRAKRYKKGQTRSLTPIAH
jgi:HEAT repeat protein